MAQYTKITPRRGSGANPTTSDLATNEVAVRTDTAKWYMNIGGTITELGDAAVGASNTFAADNIFQEKIYIDDEGGEYISGNGTTATLTGAWAAANMTITGGSVSGITDITVADGGTGASSLTDGGVLLGSGTNAITAMSVLTDGQFIVGDGSGDPVAESGDTARISLGVGSTDSPSFAGATLASSSSGSVPLLTLTNTHADAAAGEIRFNKDSATSAADDVLGSITWYGSDDGEAAQEKLAYMEVIAHSVAATSEAATMNFYVAENDANLTKGLSLVGQAAADGEIDVTIGAGAASTTTIAGTLTMGTTATMTNAGLVSVGNQSNITGVGTISSGTWEGDTVAVAQGGTGATNSNGWLNSRITTNADGSLNYDATGATAVNHDSLTGFVSNEHINWTSTSSNFSTSGTAATGALTVTGALSISGDGSNAVTFTESGSGDFTIDANDDIRLDAGGADVVYKDGGTEFGRLTNSSTDFVISSSTSDKDLIFKGNDGGSTITALTLDMSAAGAATFGGGIANAGTISAGTWQGTDVGVAYGGTGASSLNNLITLSTHTTGNYVATITGGTGITSSAATSGEGTTHSLSVDAAQTQITSTGALDGGSISSGFGNIDNGASNITSGGLVKLDVDADADDATGDSATGRLTLGASEDFNLYHGGTNSWLVTDTGDMKFVSADDFDFYPADGDAINMRDDDDDIFFRCVPEDLKLELRYKGSATNYYRMTVGASGVTTLATADSDGTAAHMTLDIDGNLTLDADAGTITFADGGSSLGTITSAGWTGNVVGNVTGNTSGTAATVTTAAQTNITSLGTLTDLTVSGTSTTIGTVTSGIWNAGAVTSSGVVTAAGFTIGSAVIGEAELEILDGATVTTTELNLLDALDRGSILYGNSSGVTAVLGQGSSDQVLTSDGTDISWEDSAGGSNYYVDGLSLSGGTITASLSGTTNQTVDITGLYTAGDGLTLNTRDIDLDASLTTVTSMLNSSLVIGRDSTDQIKFGTDNNIIFRVGNADGVTFKASGEIEATSLDISGNADIDGTLETDALTIGGTNLLTGSLVTTLGTVTAGTWQATDIGVAYGGTGVSTLTSNAVLVGNGSSAITSSSNLSFDDTNLTIAAAGKIYFRDTATYIYANDSNDMSIITAADMLISANGTMTFDSDDFSIGENSGDITLTFNGGSNDGTLLWMEDENYFQFNNDILVQDNEKIQFRDTAIYMYSSTDGQLDIVADGALTINANTVRIGRGSTGSGELRIYEDTDDGSAYVGLKAAAMSGGVTYVLPTADGSDGQQLTTDGSGNMSWAAAGSGGGGGFDTAGTGLTSSGTTVNVIGGTGVTANANDIAIGQDVATSAAVTFATVNTGQGANELYDMDQNVKTDSDVEFNRIETDGSGGYVDINNNYVQIKGDEGGAGDLMIFADQGDDNADKFKLQTDTSGVFNIMSKNTGSYVDMMTLTNAAQLTLGDSGTQNGRYQVVESSTVYNGVTGTFEFATQWMAMDLGGGNIVVDAAASQTITVKGGIVTSLS